MPASRSTWPIDGLGLPSRRGFGTHQYANLLLLQRVIVNVKEQFIRYHLPRYFARDAREGPALMFRVDADDVSNRFANIIVLA